MRTTPASTRSLSQLPDRRLLSLLLVVLSSILAPTSSAAQSSPSLPYPWSPARRGETVLVREGQVMCGSVEAFARLLELVSIGDKEAVRSYLVDAGTECAILDGTRLLVVEARTSFSLRHPRIALDLARVHFLGSPRALFVASSDLRVPNRAHEARVRRFLLRDAASGGSEETITYAWALHDLGGDSIPETIVSVGGRMQCGTGGCPTYVLRSEGDSLALVSRIFLTNDWVAAGARGVSGWRDLYLQVKQGIGRGLVWSRLAYGSQGYPSNPTVPPAKVGVELPRIATVLLRDYIEGERRTLTVGSLRR